MRVLGCVSMLSGCGGGGPDAGTDAGPVDEQGCGAHTDCGECLRNLGQGGCSWCAGTSTCVPDIDRGGVCEYGWTPEVSECDDPRLAVRSTLDVDCRVPETSDPRCQEPRGGEGAGSVGEGPDFDFSSLLVIKGGAIDAARGRVLVAFGVADASRLHGSGLMVVDLETGDRELLTGTIDDPVLGLVSAGTGSAIEGEAMDVAVAPDGTYVLAISQPAGSDWYLRLLRVDPESGERTLVAQDEPRLCSHGGRELAFGPQAVCIGCNGWDGEPRIAVGGDGTIYAPVTGQSGEYGVGALASDGSCRVVTFSDRDREIDLGTGPLFGDNVHSLALEGPSLLANVGGGLLARVDIASGTRSVVSWENQSVGDGPDVGGDTVEPSEDGQRAITAGGENRLVLVDLATGDRTHLVELGGPLSAGTIADAMFHPHDPGVIVFLQPYSVGLYEIATGNSAILSY